jgi:hypothetical protein
MIYAPYEDPYDILPNKYRIVKTSQGIQVSSKWTRQSGDPQVVKSLDYYGTRYANRLYRVLAIFERTASTAERTGNAIIGTLQVSVVILSFGAALPLVIDSIPSNFRKKQYKIFLALYANGSKTEHPITKLINKTMTYPEFMTYYNSDLQCDNPAGITNGLLERCVRVGNVALMCKLIECFGDIFLNKPAALSDLIIMACEELFNSRLPLRQVKVIVKKLIKQGARVNHFSGKTELLFEPQICHQHSPKTVLDVIFCHLGRLNKSLRTECQPIVDLLMAKGAKVYPGESCCTLKALKKKPAQNEPAKEPTVEHI